MIKLADAIIEHEWQGLGGNSLRVERSERKDNNSRIVAS